MKFVFFILLFPMMVIVKINSVIITEKVIIINTISVKAMLPKEKSKNSSYYLEEIGVRWKKATLENNDPNLLSVTEGKIQRRSTIKI